MRLTVTVVRPVSFTLVVDDNLSNEQIQEKIHKMAAELLEHKKFQIITACSLARRESLDDIVE